MGKLIIIKDAVQKLRRYNMIGRILQFKLNPIHSGVEPVAWIRDGINEIK